MSGDHEPCELVIGLNAVVMKREMAFGELRADVTHIKEKLDNGFFKEIYEKLDALKDTLNAQAVKDATRNGATKLREKEKDSEDWFLRIFSGSAKKIIGFLITFVMISSIVTALVVGAGWIAIKIGYFKESPFWQQQILATVEYGYHAHTQKDGKILWHTGQPDKKAWLIDLETGKREGHPELRTEQ